VSTQKPKIFLSYAHIDLGMAIKIYSDLKQYGLDIWFDKESLLPGQDWEKEIKKAISESDFFIILLSEKCLSKRGFVHSELRSSFEIVEKFFPSDSGIVILPVRLDNCKPSDAYERLGKLHWIDVFPESEYQDGLKKILKVISKETFVLRSEPKELSQAEVTETIITHDFYETSRNPSGKGVNHRYYTKNIQEDVIILDELTGLMWQQSGSNDLMDFEQAKNWILELNKKGFAGYHDWRLPTVEEAMSLMESEEKEGLYIDSVFDGRQSWIWTADLTQEQYGAWVVLFITGHCSDSLWHQCYCVRAVRTVQSSSE
jgi:hypothetical protein